MRAKNDGKKEKGPDLECVEWCAQLRPLSHSTQRAPRPKKLEHCQHRASGQNAASPACLVVPPPSLDPDTTKDKNPALPIWRGRQHVGAGVCRADTN